MRHTSSPTHSQHHTPRAVALVSREYPPFFGGGIGTYARFIVPALADAGVNVHVITQAHDRTQPRTEFQGPVTVHRVPVTVGRGGWTTAALRFAIGAAKIVDRLWATNAIDAVEYPECEAAGAVALLGGACTPNPRNNAATPPTIVQLHTPSEQLFALGSLSSRQIDPALAAYFILERHAITRAHAVLAPSTFIAHWAHQRYNLPDVPEVIHYAAQPQSDPLPPSPPHADPCVLYAGRLEPRKGVEPLCIAWNRVHEAHPNATLVLAGADTAGAPDGGSMRAYLNQILTPEARAQTRFLGRISPHALKEEAARADLCVIPSLWENFPNTCIEAMQNSRAVLASDNGGMREMFQGTIAGETCRAGDPHHLAHTMTAMLSEGKQHLAERGRVARAHITELCKPSRIAQQRIAHFQRVINTHRSAQTTAKAKSNTAANPLDFWRTTHAILAGTHTTDLPELPPQLAQWAGATRGAHA